jgi:exosortase A-associated hydrolase 2
MLAAPSHPPAHPFFLDAAPGRRFCLYHRPRGEVLGAVLQVPAFGEEMNKARRMCALQARLLAEQGYGVLQIDLYGCGDSDGDFRDARWEIWKSDLQAALFWLRRECPGSMHLWALRLGALLALDCARDAGDIERMLLWQPVSEGAAYLTQFLRLRLAADMLHTAAGEGGESGGGKQRGGTEALRKTLEQGISLEIAGYELAPQLAFAIDALDLARLPAPSCAIDWFEIVPSSARAPAPGRARLIRHCGQAGWRIRNHVVEAPAFWASQEIVEAPGLLAASVAALQAHCA